MAVLEQRNVVLVLKNMVIGSVTTQIYGSRQCQNAKLWLQVMLKKNVVIGSVKHKFLAIDSVRTQHYGDRRC
jgi:hypothetical protein